MPNQVIQAVVIVELVNIDDHFLLDALPPYRLQQIKWSRAVTFDLLLNCQNGTFGALRYFMRYTTCHKTF